MTEQPEHRHATVGDALMYLFRAVVRLFFLLILLAALGGFLIWWDQHSYQSLALERVALIEDRDITIADLGSKLNECLLDKAERLEALPPGLVIQDPPPCRSGADTCQPWERDWDQYRGELRPGDTVPALPQGD